MRAYVYLQPDIQIFVAGLFFEQTGWRKTYIIYIIKSNYLKYILFIKI